MTHASDVGGASSDVAVQRRESTSSAVRPLVSIVIPVFDDEATVWAALESAAAQTLDRIEIICVDDASTDDTVGVVERFQRLDRRVRLIRKQRNRSALQSRRDGVAAARGDYVLFLDADDELAKDAAERAFARAEASGADLVGFGVTVVEKDGRSGGAYERRLQPAHASLRGTDVLRGLFPVRRPAQGQLWRFLFRREILVQAYALIPEELVLPRINDLPLLFLVAALATSYESIPHRLYRYHFGRGGSGQSVDSIERAEFYASAIRSMDSIHPSVGVLAATHPDAATIWEAYDSARLSIIGYVCFQLAQGSDSTVIDAALAHLQTLTSIDDIVQAATTFYPATLSTLRLHLTLPPAIDGSTRSSILLATSTLRTGGVTAVLLSQARLLRDAGFRVSIVARNTGSSSDLVPTGVEFFELRSRNLVERLTEWAELCRRQSVDLVIDHQVLYSDHWPEFALAARASGAATIGWLHNFVGRPVYDGNDRLSLIERCSGTLERLMVLSPLDVAYFKLRGLTDVSYLPNPPSPLLVNSLAHPVSRRSPGKRVELIWWGRLEQRTKQVYELIEVGVELRRLSLDFRLTVIGPDWDDTTAAKFNTHARRRGVGDAVRAIGERRGEALIHCIDAADAFVSTSIVEGYQLTIAEAQARGLPVFMYELPWLTLVQNNHGIVAVPQGDAPALAREIVRAAADRERLSALSRAAIAAAQRVLEDDFAALYRDVVLGELSPHFSPQPTLEDARELLHLLVFFAGRDRRERRRSAPSPLIRRLWQGVAPAGKTVLRRLPGLRPLAHRVKRWLRLG